MKARTWALLLGTAVILVFIWRRDLEPERTEIGVTRELVGRWVTKSARHADRYLLIQPGAIVFGLGEDGESRHRVTGVFQERGSAGRYVVAYEVDDPDAGDASVVEVRLQVRDEELYLEHLPGVPWRQGT